MASRRKLPKRSPAKTPSEQAQGQQPASPPEAPTRRRSFTRWQLLAIAIVLLGLGWFAVARFVSERRFGEGLAALRIHRFELADQRLQQAARWYRRGGEVALIRGRVAWVKGDMNASQDWIRKAAMQGLDPQRAEHERSLAQVRGGSADAQRSRLPAMLRQRPEDGPAILEAFAAGFLARGDVDQATEMLTLWEEADANDPRIHYWRGMLNRAFGKDTEAIEHFQRALRIAPEMTRSRLAWAELLKSFYFYPEALVQYQRVLREQPGMADAQLGLAVCQLRTHQVDEGVRGLAACIAGQPDNVAARLALAEYYQDENRPADVLATIQPLLEADTIDITLNYLAATAFARLGKQTQSDKYFEKFQRLSRQLETTKLMTQQYEREPSPELARQIATDLLQCKWQDAGTWILEALSSRPQSVELNQMMAEYLRLAGRPTVADSYEKYASRLRSQATIQQ